MKDEFYFPSKDGNTEIHTVCWYPDQTPRAVVQICHGMLEYVERYEDFALYLAKNGFLVVGNDHLGHGKSVQSRAEYGYMHKVYGHACLLADVHTLRRRMQEKYSDVPYFIFGHSMGSTIVRHYISLYGEGLSGVILSGAVAKKSRLTIKAGKALCRLNGLLFGWHHRSRLIRDMAIGGYNKKFKPRLTNADWISSDASVVQKYIKDPLCTFGFTVNGYYTLIDGMEQAQKKEYLFMIQKKMPVFIVSGAHDPVGNFGKGVRKIFASYKGAGIKDVTMKLYPQMRHEILNEIDRETVYEDLLLWMEERI